MIYNKMEALEYLSEVGINLYLNEKDEEVIDLLVDEEGYLRYNDNVSKYDVSQTVWELLDNMLMDLDNEEVDLLLINALEGKNINAPRPVITGDYLLYRKDPRYRVTLHGMDSIDAKARRVFCDWVDKHPKLKEYIRKAVLTKDIDEAKKLATKATVYVAYTQRESGWTRSLIGNISRWIEYIILSRFGCKCPFRTSGRPLIT